LYHEPTPGFPKNTSPIAAECQSNHLKPKVQKPGNNIPNSRDARAARGKRQMKTPHNSQTLFRICGDFQP